MMVALSSLPSYFEVYLKRMEMVSAVMTHLMKGAASRSLYDNTAEAVDYRWYKSNTIVKNRKLSFSGRAGGIELMALSRWVASFRPAHARRFRDHLGTDSARSKLPPLCVPVSPSPVSREASLDLCRSIGPSTIVVFKLRPSLWTHPLCPNI